MFTFDGDNALTLLRGFTATKSVELVKSDHHCPKCETLLDYTERSVVHLDPPRKRVACQNCGYTNLVEVGDPAPAQPLSVE